MPLNTSYQIKNEVFLYLLLFKLVTFSLPYINVAFKISQMDKKMHERHFTILCEIFY